MFVQMSNNEIEISVYRDIIKPIVMAIVVICLIIILPMLLLFLLSFIAYQWNTKDFQNNWTISMLNAVTNAAMFYAAGSCVALVGGTATVPFVNVRTTAVCVGSVAGVLISSALSAVMQQ